CSARRSTKRARNLVLGSGHASRCRSTSMFLSIPEKLRNECLLSASAEGAGGPQSDPAFARKRARVAGAGDRARRAALEGPFLAAWGRLRLEHHEHRSLACRN